MNRRKKKKKNRNSTFQLSENTSLDTLNKAGRPLFLREILHLSHCPPEMKQKAKKLVRNLLKAGKILLLKGNRYALTREIEVVTGELSVHPDGFGFVKVEENQGPDLFIPPRHMKGAVHGDRVAVRIERTDPKGPVGYIIRIIEHKQKKIVGTYLDSRHFGVVKPEDERIHIEILIPKEKAGKARDGDAVVAIITDFSPTGNSVEGKIVEVLGDPEEIKVQSRIVIHKHNLPHKFSKKALQQAEDLPDMVVEEDLKGRRDIRSLPLVTIDGEHARDFDDAVHVKRTRSGYILTVAIADVSHYVQKSSPLDQDAIERGTSVYFPDKVIPMLPEALSNHLCSLVPDEDRLCMVARIYFDKQGNVTKSTFFKAVMRSHNRLTYSLVKELLDGKDKRLAKQYSELVPGLQNMEELARLLMERRRKRGSIDFDLPEPEVILGLTGELDEIVLRERNIAHRLIEEFMIAANEAVARYLAERSIPTLFRIHDKPDREKIEDFVKFLQTLGYNITLPNDITPFWCQKILNMVKGKPAEYIVNSMLIRTMQQAVYSEENKGHFGLASPTYLHFTSPIRRYPDLIVHRILKANLRKPRKRPVYNNEELHVLGEEMSQRERTAMEAEREMLDRLKIRYMEDKIGETFAGIISSITSFGMFVELKELFISGVVKLVDMADDYYEYDSAAHCLIGRGTGKRYRVGQEVNLRLVAINKARRHINFVLVEDGEGIEESNKPKKQCSTKGSGKRKKREKYNGAPGTKQDSVKKKERRKKSSR